jgi:hypothetical protein
VRYYTGEVDRYGNKIYAVGVFKDVFEYHKATQEGENWCWAACVQMVLHYQGLRIEQRDLVRRALGNVVDRPGDSEDIATAAHGWRVNGKTIVAKIGSISESDLIDDLAYRYPVIVGLSIPGQNVGHAYVLTAIFFYYDRTGRRIPFEVVLRDPSPGRVSRTVLSWNNFYSRVHTVVHVYPQ